MSIVSYDRRSLGGEDVLACPHCGNSYLHHNKVTIYDRDEDEPRVLCTEIDCRTAKMQWIANNSRNPSSRRHGLTIEFCCENCGGRSELTIAQHKGETFLGWR